MREHRLRLIAVALAVAVLPILARPGRAFGPDTVSADLAPTGTPSRMASDLAEDQEKAVISILPENTQVSVGEIFTVTVRIDVGLAPVDVVEAHIEFNPKVLQVVTLVFGTTLPDPAWWLGDFVDNEHGHVAYGASQTFSQAGVTGAFDLVSIRLRSVRPSIMTTLSFSDAEDRKTIAVSEGYSVPLRLVDAEVVIANFTPTPTAAATATPTSTTIVATTPTPTLSATPAEPFPLKLLLPLVFRAG